MKQLNNDTVSVELISQEKKILLTIEVFCFTYGMSVIWIFSSCFAQLSSIINLTNSSLRVEEIPENYFHISQNSGHFLVSVDVS